MSTRRMFQIATLGLIFTAVTACSKPRSTDDSCARCHMTIKPGDLHVTYITYADGSDAHFDATICALHLWQHPPAGHTPRAMRVHEYYDGGMRNAANIMLVRDSDVAGPMGADYIAVDPANLKKFQADHGGTAFKLADIKLASPEGEP
ncbi:MAG: nitrous oxide reductase accessory protein NosL [Polyangiaceae bacterium]